MVPKICFDTNTYEPIVNAEQRSTSQCQANAAAYEDIHNLIKMGRIHPFVPESIFTFELYNNDQRAAIIKNYTPKVSSEILSQDDKSLKITMTIEPNPKNSPSFSNNCYSKKNFQAAIDAGFKVLRRPARYMGYQNFDLHEKVFAPNSISEKEEQERMCEHALHWIERMWGCGKASADKMPQKKVFAELADSDALASCYGYDIHYFCTNDEGRSAGAGSILHVSHRKKIKEKLNIDIISPQELINML
jgi:hypothetical protein